jgi:anti-anti-sigma factor
MEELFPGNRGDGPVYADGHLVVTRTTQPFGLRFAGEIDVSNSDAMARSLRVALTEGLQLHLDLSGLTFCDISGIRALVDTAHGLGDGRQLRLHGLPRQLQTVLRVIGWSDGPRLALCDCEVAGACS